MARASKAALCESSTKSLVVLLFLGLVLIVTLFDYPTEFSMLPKAQSSSAARRLLLHPSTTQQFNTGFHPKQSSNKNVTDRQYKVSAHEVPSGPNPESNK